MGKAVQAEKADKCVGCGGTGERWEPLVTAKCGHMVCEGCLWKLRGCPRCRLSGIPLVRVG